MLRVALLAALLLASCRGFGPPPEELRELLDTEAPTPKRFVATARIDSERIGGEFRAVAIVDGARARVQLLPPLGGKVLDLVAGAEGARGYWPQLARSIRPGERDPGAFIGTSVLENATPLAFERVRGARRVGDGWLLDLIPASGDPRASVVACLDGRGRLLSRSYRYRRVGWEEHFEPVHRFESRGFAWTLTDESVEVIDSPPESLFQLELPDGVAP